MNLNATILGQTISFILFVWFCMKYIWPPIISAIETRQRDIENSLIRSKKAQEELHVIQKKIHQQIKEAKDKALYILNEADKQKELILDKAKQDALEESKKIFIKTQSEIEIEMILARKNLHQEIVQLSTCMAEKIIKKNIQNNQDQDLINNLTSFLLQVKP